MEQDISEDELKELKIILAEHYAKKAVQAADDYYQKNNLTDSDMELWLNKTDNRLRVVSDTNELLVSAPLTIIISLLEISRGLDGLF